MANVSGINLSHLFILIQEMFDATLKDRELSFQSAPGTTMFLHWLVGMVYVFYFASFILLLREVSPSCRNVTMRCILKETFVLATSYASKAMVIS